METRPYNPRPDEAPAGLAAWLQGHLPRQAPARLRFTVADDGRISSIEISSPDATVARILRRLLGEAAIPPGLCPPPGSHTLGLRIPA